MLFSGKGGAIMSFIDLSLVPESVKLDLCDLAYRKAVVYFQDPDVQIRYQKWLAERNQQPPEESPE